MSKIHERRIRNKISTPNEVRDEIGLKRRPDGDEMVEQGTQARAEASAQTRGSRTRDAERSANAADTDGEARQPKGEGRATG